MAGLQCGGMWNVERRSKDRPLSNCRYGLNGEDYPIRLKSKVENKNLPRRLEDTKENI